MKGETGLVVSQYGQLATKTVGSVVVIRRLCDPFARLSRTSLLETPPSRTAYQQGPLEMIATALER